MREGDASPDGSSAPAVLSELDLDVLETRLDEWLDRQLDDNPVVAAVDQGEPGQRRWYVRMHGEEKDVFTIWLTLGQRTLAYETYVMPAPEENEGQLYEHLLRRNRKLFGAHFAIGDEDAIFLVGQFPSESLTEPELDRIIGSLYAWTEQFFRPAMRLGYASKFRG